jgi:hypothetical protein
LVAGRERAIRCCCNWAPISRPSPSACAHTCMSSSVDTIAPEPASDVGLMNGWSSIACVT